MSRDGARLIRCTVEIGKISSKVVDIRFERVDALPPAPSPVSFKMALVRANRFGRKPLNARDVGDERIERVEEVARGLHGPVVSGLGCEHGHQDAPIMGNSSSLVAR